MNGESKAVTSLARASAPRRTAIGVRSVLAAAALLAACTGQVREPGAAAGAATTRAGASGSARSSGLEGPSATAIEEYFARQVAAKRMTDSVFTAVLGDEMVVRKVTYPGADGLEIPAYLFAPRDTTRRRPVIVFVHGGIHGDFGLVHLRQVRSLVRQGYLLVAPEYRGSTGYGRAFFEAIDYGGKEVEDVVAAREYLATRVRQADLERTGIMGYSHGGYIALLAVMRYPERFRVAVAHVPVADLPTRMRTHPDWYHQLFVDQPAYGARLEENPAPYLERSPSTHARSLRVPVLVHAADNDDDVFIEENRILRDSMVAAGKDTAGLYTYREFRSPPGGHSFGVLDTPEGRESWRETLAFLARHLDPRRAERQPL